MLCENTYELAQYERQQDILEREWVISLPEKRSACIDLAIDIMLDRADDDVFYRAFEPWYDNINDEYSPEILDTLTLWQDGEYSDEDWLLLSEIAIAVLEAAVEILYNTTIEDILSDGYPLSYLLKDILKL